MIDIWGVVQWWDNWQLRILVLGSLGLQWFLLLAAPMRKYTVPHALRTCIWLAYISSDALAIYALATLFNRHARTVPASYCPAPTKGGGGPGGNRQEQSRILEVLWAPILLIHLGGQEELTAYEIEDNELWTRNTVTLVSQVSVALYAFYKSWQPSGSDGGKLTAAAILLFVIGVISFSEKPFALNRAKIKRLAAVSAWIQGTKEPSVWRERLRHFSLFEESDCYTLLPRLSPGGWPGAGAGGRSRSRSRSMNNNNNNNNNKHRHRGGRGDENKPPTAVALSEGDKVLMVLSDMSLLAAANDLVERKRAKSVDEVLPPLLLAEQNLAHWLRGAFAFIYTRASVVVTPVYLLYHLMLVPVLHVAALALFAASDKRGYKRADVKITYVVLCLTAALDFLAVFVRQLVYRFMTMTQVPPLCETVPEYNLIDEAVREADKGVGWIYRCARQLGFHRTRHSEVYRKVAATVIPDLVLARNRDLASYRVFDIDDNSAAAAATTTKNWAISKHLQKCCGEKIKASLGISFDRSVLLWHIATDLCFRCMDDVDSDGDDDDEEEEVRGAEPPPPPGAVMLSEEEEEDEAAAAAAGSAAMGSINPPPPPPVADDPQQQGQGESIDPVFRLKIKCTQAISNYMAHLLDSNPEMLLTGSRHHLISEARVAVRSSFFSTSNGAPASDVCRCSSFIGSSCTCSCTCSKLNKQGGVADLLRQKDLLNKRINDIADGTFEPPENTTQVFHIIKACELASELLKLPERDRWELLFKVWLGMLCYSASMCRGYLHAKSLGEGGEFLSFVWLLLSLKGAKTLADKLQLPQESQDSDN